MSNGLSMELVARRRIPVVLECLIFLAVALLYVGACMNFPLSLFCHQVFDDALYIKLAQSIASGQWLGDYNELTLVKGPFFPLFLAANHFLGLPVTLSLALVYALSSWLFVYSLRSIGVPFVLGLVLYILLLFQPALFPTRILRDNLYTSITLIVLATGVLLISKKAPYWNAVFCGLALAAFFLTREEGIWIFPGLLVLVAGTWFLSRRGFYGEWSRAKKILLPGVLFACFFVPIQIVSAINLFQYGYYGITDMKARGFKSAIDAVQSVVIGPPVAFVPAPASTRAEIYKHSPAFAELRGDLEYEQNPFKNSLANLYPQTVNEIAGGWFLWAFRDAVARRGYYSSVSAAESYYSRIAEEISQAQGAGLLPRVGSPISLMPPLSSDNLSLIPESFRSAFTFLLYQKHIPLDQGPSVGTKERLADFRSFLGNPKTVPSVEEPANPPGKFKALKTKRSLIRFYKAATPVLLWLSLLSLVGILLAVFFKRNKAAFRPLLAIVGLAIAALFFSRIFMIVLVDICSFPAIGTNYLGPGFPWLPAFSVLCLSLLLQILKRNPDGA